MDDYKETYHCYTIAARVAHGRGVVYKSSKIGPYKIASRLPPRHPYNRAREKIKTLRFINWHLSFLAKR